MKHQQKLDSISDLSWFSYGYWILSREVPYSKNTDVRTYVGVIWFVFHVPPTPTDQDSNNKTCVSLANPTMKHQQKLD